jgi:hypothetical protein
LRAYLNKEIAMDRLTYKSSMGDYGCAKEFNSDWEEKCAFRNRLGEYEDLGLTAAEIREKLKEAVCEGN